MSFHRNWADVLGSVHLDFTHSKNQSITWHDNAQISAKMFKLKKNLGLLACFIIYISNAKYTVYLFGNSLKFSLFKYLL